MQAFHVPINGKTGMCDRQLLLMLVVTSSANVCLAQLTVALRAIAKTASVP